MPILNTGSDNFDNDLTEMLEGLQQQRSNLLGTIVDLHVGLGLLAGAEADRLAKKYGTEDARAQLLRDRSEAAATRVNALAVEHEIASVRTPAPPSTGALIQGRITDVTQRAAGNVSVQLVDQKGQPVLGVNAVDADDNGYFAIQLNPDTVKAIGTDSKLVLLLRGADAQLVPAAVQPISIAPGATVIQSVSLSTAELERLRLRMAVAVTPVTVTPQASDAPTVVDTAAANKAAADKIAAEKAAAEKAAAEKAAAEKAAAEKAAAEKAAADKAAADKAAAGKAAAEKAAAEKAAAEKAAAEKAAAEKAAADKAAADKAAAGKAAADKAAASKPAPKTKSAKDKPAPHKPPAKPRGRTGGGNKR